MKHSGKTRGRQRQTKQIEQYRKVTEVVRQHAAWKKPEVMYQICRQLDQEKMPIPLHWQEWADRTVEGWVDAYRLDRCNVIKAVEYRLKKTRQAEFRKVPRTSNGI